MQPRTRQDPERTTTNVAAVPVVDGHAEVASLLGHTPAELRERLSFWAQERGVSLDAAMDALVAARPFVESLGGALRDTRGALRQLCIVLARIRHSQLLPASRLAGDSRWAARYERAVEISCLGDVRLSANADGEISVEMGGVALDERVGTATRAIREVRALTSTLLDAVLSENWKTTSVPPGECCVVCTDEQSTGVAWPGCRGGHWVCRECARRIVSLSLFRVPESGTSVYTWLHAVRCPVCRASIVDRGALGDAPFSPLDSVDRRSCQRAGEACCALFWTAMDVRGTIERHGAVYAADSLGLKLPRWYIKLLTVTTTSRELAYLRLTAAFLAEFIAKWCVGVAQVTGNDGGLYLGLVHGNRRGAAVYSPLLGSSEEIVVTRLRSLAVCAGVEWKTGRLDEFGRGLVAFVPTAIEAAKRAWSRAREWIESEDHPVRRRSTGEGRRATDS